MFVSSLLLTCFFLYRCSFPHRLHAPSWNHTLQTEEVWRLARDKLFEGNFWGIVGWKVLLYHARIWINPAVNRCMNLRSLRHEPVAVMQMPLKDSWFVSVDSRRDRLKTSGRGFRPSLINKVGTCVWRAESMMKRRLKKDYPKAKPIYDTPPRVSHFGKISDQPVVPSGDFIGSVRPTHHSLKAKLSISDYHLGIFAAPQNSIYNYIADIAK